MDFKVRCVKYNANERHFTIGKVYEVKDGVLVSDYYYPFSAWSYDVDNYESNIDALNDWFKDWYEFELVQELKYKIGDRVVIEDTNVSEWCGSDKGVTGVIVDIDEDYRCPYLVQYDTTGDRVWCTVSGLVEKVEEKKVFTKSDLKNGDIVLTRNEQVYIAIVDLGVMLSKTGFNRFSEYTDDLICNHNDCEEFDVVAVRRPKAEYECQFNAFDCDMGELVYDRERDTVRELTIEEIEKEFGIKVKFERV